MTTIWQPIRLVDLVEMLDEDTGDYRYSTQPSGRPCIRHRHTGEVLELDMTRKSAFRIRKAVAQELAELVSP